MHGVIRAICAALTGFIPLVSTAANAADEAVFRVGVADVLSVSIWEMRDLDQLVTVRPDGRISLQLLGDVDARERTVAELSAELQSRYRRVLGEATVTVSLQELNSQVVYFVGEVEKTGPLPLTRKLTLLQAAALTGGFTDAADLETAYVLRADSVFPVNFRELMRSPDLEKNLQLMPGDTVVVPPGESAYVQGEVRHPGVLRLTRDLTVLQALAEAGGLTEMARPSRAYLLRGRGESKIRIEIDVAAMMNESDRFRDIPLEPDDILTVPERLF